MNPLPAGAADVLAKEERLRGQLAGLPSLLVALSGGTDSVTYTLPPMVTLCPTTVSPPRMVALG